MSTDLALINTDVKVAERTLPIGTEVRADGVAFRVWAPKRNRVDVVFEAADAPLSAALNSEGNGYFSATIPEAKAGMRYRFRLDGESDLYPDPISRFQPDGPLGPSQIVDSSAFEWTDTEFKGVGGPGVVLYEMHIGTFTPEGTWAAAMEKLQFLKDLGINCLEIMPIAEFAGKFGWGYDGVDLFAPTRLYGSPDDFRKFVDRAHSIGLGIILDVVYNHLGPTGNYLPVFADTFFKQHKNDWGDTINFDEAGSEGVRELYISNARYWIQEFHIDGYRYDATQAIHDRSKDHILAVICRAAREAAGAKRIYLITENEPQETKLVRAPETGGYGMDALWNDDFHHSAIVALTGRNEAYLTDYYGKPQEFISAIKYGYLYQGQFYRWQRKCRGTSTAGLPPTAFVNYIQNHDQIANYGHGQRAHHLSSLAQFKTMTAFLLLAPQTPLLFQGEEFASSSTFHYFADHNEELNKLIHEGRARELSQFPSNSMPDMQANMRVPSSDLTFHRCKLDWSEPHQGFHSQILLMHKVLLELRRTERALVHSQHEQSVDGAVLGPNSFVLRFFSPDGTDDRLLVINLDGDLHLDIIPEPLLASPCEMRWESVFSTEEARFGGNGAPPLETRGEDWRLPGESWRLPGRCATLLKPSPVTVHQTRQEMQSEAKREEERQAGLGNKQ